jgi:hypothetical protein
MVRRQRKLSSRRAKKKGLSLGLNREVWQHDQVQKERHSARNVDCHTSSDELRGVLKEEGSG